MRECQTIGVQCQDSDGIGPLPFMAGSDRDCMHTFKMGDLVERREWIGMTRGRIVEVKPDEATVVVEWQVGFRLAGSTTIERIADLRGSR